MYKRQGYGSPVIERAIAEQSRKLIHTSNLFYHEGQAELALRLTERSGLDRVFFANTGTEAWEGALKLAHDVKRNPREYRHALDAKQMVLMFERCV